MLVNNRNCFLRHQCGVASSFRGAESQGDLFRVRDDHSCTWKREDSKKVSMRMTAVHMVLRMVAVDDNFIW